MSNHPSHLPRGQDIYRVHYMDQPTVRERWARREYDVDGRPIQDVAGERLTVPPQVRWPHEPGPVARSARAAWEFLLDWLTASLFLAGVLGACVLGFSITEHLTGSGWPGLAFVIVMGGALCASGARPKR